MTQSTMRAMAPPSPHDDSKVLSCKRTLDAKPCGMGIHVLTFTILSITKTHDQTYKKDQRHCLRILLVNEKSSATQKYGTPFFRDSQFSKINELMHPC